MRGEVNWRKHEAAVERKRHKVEFLRALIAEHTEVENPDFDYLRKLKYKLRSCEQNLGAMK